MIELILFLIEAFTGSKRSQTQSSEHRHTLEPGTDLEGARAKVDRFGLDHAVPVTVFEVGPDALIQPARVRAGEKRRQIEQRLEAEALARDAAEAPESDRMELPPVDHLEPPPEVTSEGAAYPYKFQDKAKVTHRVMRAEAHPVAVVAKTMPIQHALKTERAHKRKRSAVAKLLTQPSTLAQILQAKAVLEPPPSLRSRW